MGLRGKRSRIRADSFSISTTPSPTTLPRSVVHNVHGFRVHGSRYLGPTLHRLRARFHEALRLLMNHRPEQYAYSRSEDTVMIATSNAAPTRFTDDVLPWSVINVRKCGYSPPYAPGESSRNGYDFPRRREPKRLDRTMSRISRGACWSSDRGVGLFRGRVFWSFLFFFLFKISPLKKEHGNVTAIRFEFFATLINAWSEIARGNRRAINEGKKKIGVYYQRYGVELWSVEMADRLPICARIVGYSAEAGWNSILSWGFIYGIGIDRSSYQIYYILTNGESVSLVEKNCWEKF